jgi:hypothetical protein
MTKLVDMILKDGVRERVISDLDKLIDAEVGDRKGVTGLAIKGGYKFVKTIKKDFVRDALQGLLPDFVIALDKFYGEHGSPKGFDAFMMTNKSRVADGMLSVTDTRRDRTSNAAIKKAYDKLRPLAKSNVEQAIPRLSVLIQKHIDSLV